MKSILCHPYVYHSSKRASFFWFAADEFPFPNINQTEMKNNERKTINRYEEGVGENT